VLVPQGVEAVRTLDQRVTVAGGQTVTRRERLRVTLITSTPQQLIDQGTDLAYMRQLRKELAP